MYKLVLAMLMAVVPAMVEAHTTQALNRYWQYDEYLASSPNQQILTEMLSKAVRQNPAPLTLKQNEPISISVVYPGHGRKARSTCLFG